MIGELEFAEPGERPANVVAFDDVAFDEPCPWHDRAYRVMPPRYIPFAGTQPIRRSDRRSVRS